MVAPAAGWYDDPEVGGQERWWDGGAWTVETRPARPNHTPRPPQQSVQGPPAYGTPDPASHRQPPTPEPSAAPPQPSPYTAAARPMVGAASQFAGNLERNPNSMRILLFLGTNMGVLMLVTVVGSVLGIASGGLLGLAALSLVFGMGGAFVSLLASKWIAKMSTGAEVIETPKNNTEQWLVSTVADLAQRSNIGMPEVAIFPSDAPNAFATGAKRNDSLVAVSTGLLQTMNEREVRAVLAHEVAHIANGDMVTLTLVQGVVNAVVIFLSRLIGMVIASAFRRGGGIVYFITVLVLQVIFGFLATLVVMWFSRQREYRADKGAADLVGAQDMAAALRRLEGDQRDADLPEQMAALGIRSSKTGWLGELVSSHPSIPDRIAALQAA